MSKPLRAVAVLLAFSSGLSCGSKPEFVVVRPIHQTREHSMRSQFANTTEAADEAIAARDRAVFAWVAASQVKVQPLPTDPSPVTPPVHSGVTVAAAPSSPWDCIAEAETGSDYTMHGSTYSTAFGLVNDIIFEYGTPEEQSAVFSGTATREQEIDIASRFAADHGFGGWGALTRQKCGLR